MEKLDRFRVAKCCGVVDLRLGTLIVLALDCISGIGILLSGIIPGVVPIYGTVPSIINGIITILISAYAIHGVLKDKSRPVLIWIYYEIARIIYTIIICILAPFVASIPIAAIPMGIISILIMVYLLMVVYSYYKEMLDGVGRTMPNV